MFNISELDNGFEFIDSLDDSNEYLIDFLKRFNIVYNNLKKFNTGFDYHIVVENVPDNCKNELFDAIFNLLNVYGLKLTLSERSKENKCCVHVTEESKKNYLSYHSGITKSNCICVYTFSSSPKKHELFFGTDYDKNKYLFLNYGDIKKEDACKEIMNKLDNNSIKYNLSYKDFEILFDFIINNGISSSIGFSGYLYSLIVKWILETNSDIVDDKFLNSIIPQHINFNLNNNDIVLDNLVGLNNIKKEINSLKNYVSYCKKNNIDMSNTYLNMFFLGNPGTGKTTVAELIAEEFYKLGLIKENKIVCVVPNDLMGKYVGQTSENARNVFNKAEGGILFIDEAYNMLSSRVDKGGLFMQEAVEELLKYLENPKNIVIFSGYKNEMLNLYKINPGLKSRIYKNIYFDDFTIDELTKILCLNLSRYNLKLGINSSAMSKVLDVFKNVKNDDSFGNARFCEKFAQDIFMNHINSGNESKKVAVNDVISCKYINTEGMGF